MENILNHLAKKIRKKYAARLGGMSSKIILYLDKKKEPIKGDDNELTQKEI